MKTTNTITISKTAQKYLNIIASGKITENELIALNSFYNKSKENQTVINSALYEDDTNELMLTDEQNKKGFDFLQGLRFTQTGRERLNNPFGYREEKILDNFSHFTFCGFYDAGNYNHSFYIRMYNCYSKDGSCFQYYYNGKMNIIG